MKNLAAIFVVIGMGSTLLGAPASAEERAVKLFNGKDLSGWEGNPNIWSVVDGAIVGHTSDEQPIKQNTFLICKEELPKSFRLTLEYLIEGGNSGVQYRSKVIDADGWVVGGYQADIDSAQTFTGIMYEERGRGILTQRGQRTEIDAQGQRKTADIGDAAQLQKSVHSGDWNTYIIEANGPRMSHIINDKLMSETIDLEDDKRADDGVLALQVHTGPSMTVRFRNIQVEELDPRSENAAQTDKD